MRLKKRKKGEGEAVAAADELREQHLVIQENQRGISFDTLLGPYLKGARKIIITDAYLRMFYQIRNLMELLETIVRLKEAEDEVFVHLVTGKDEFNDQQQEEYFNRIATACSTVGIQFSWVYDDTIHARHIITDGGWKISLDRGLDIFQRYEMNDAFDFANRIQTQRACKGFEVTILRVAAAAFPG